MRQASDSPDKAAKPPLSAFGFKQVIEDEKAYIRNRRKQLKNSVHTTVSSNAAGLALSGGGIRSAAFCIGAMQALEAFPQEDQLPDRGPDDPDLFSRLDYLSSVSGGGYAASCVSASVAATGRFPFPSRLNSDEPAVLRHIRDHSNYLFPRGFLKGLGPNLTVFLRGFIGHLPFFLAVLLFLVVITVLANPTFEDLNKPDIFGLNLPSISGNFVLSGLVLLLAIVFIYGWSFVESAKVATALDPQTWENKATSLLFIAFVGVAFLEFQPYVLSAVRRMQIVGIFSDAGTKAPSTVKPATFLDLIVGLVRDATIPLTALAGFVATVKSVLGSGEPGTEPTGIKGIFASIANKSIIWLAGLAVPLLFWIAYLYLCFWAIIPQGTTDRAAILHLPLSLQSFAMWVSAKKIFHAAPGEVMGMLYVYLMFVLGILSLFQRPNANSAHILYKERLAAAFLVKQGDEGKIEENRLAMKTIGDTAENPLAPLHLVNSALNIQGSAFANSRGRDADIFTFSQLHTGSEATLYAPTGDAPKDLDHATAMAASAAAASTAMGSNQIGLLGFTLAFLNIRLGYWLTNPRKWLGGEKKKLEDDRWAFINMSPYKYLTHEIFGQLREDYPQIYLTDGGHIENLGLYSLLKRRCKFIIVLDAEADPEMRFPSFAIAQRYARIDLGVRIDMSTQAIAKHSIETRNMLNQTCKTGKDGKVANFPPRDAGPHCALGRIKYPPNPDDSDDGILLYVKLSISGDENDYMTDYARRYRAFPHETTGDQFFSEEQFECYRALGFHALNNALRCKDKVEFPDEGDPPATLMDNGSPDGGGGPHGKMIVKLREILGSLAPRPDTGGNNPPQSVATSKAAELATGDKNAQEDFDPGTGSTGRKRRAARTRR